ncbi:transposase [Brucella anthropi]|uniref:transposase n=1 Tax=Brucella anthropi TaxID=529 RepID=UPI0034E5F38B
MSNWSRQRALWFLFLPPYSPDLNPIEMGFLKTQGTSEKASSTQLRRHLKSTWRYHQSLLHQ